MKSFVCLLIIFLIASTTVAKTNPQSQNIVAFINVNVIPMDKERVLKNQTVVVRDGIIMEIGYAGKVKVPKDAHTIDGKGKFLIPGLTDMHVHLMSDDEFPDSLAEDELKVMIANGVTTIRFMIGTPEQLILRKRSANGEIIAPTIFAASPHFIGKQSTNAYVVMNEQEARESVRRAKQDGYDFLKVTTNLKPEVYEAIVDEAKKQNIRVVGHADSRFIGLQRALKAGQQIEHLDSYLETLLPESSPIKGSVSDIYLYQAKNWESLDYIDESRIPELAKATVKSNPFVTPTLHLFKFTVGKGRTEESIKAQPDIRFYPKKTIDFWLNVNKRLTNIATPERRAKYVAVRDKIVKAIYDAGGKIMAGSDTPEWLILYGFTLHLEMEDLRDAGLSNYAALEAATRNPAEFLGTLKTSGTIEKGKRADLVLLDANPLENISNTQKRSGVMLKGRYYTQTEMNKWLDEIAPKFQHALDNESHMNEEKEVAAVPDKLFEAMRAKNADAIRALFILDGQLVAIDKPRDGKGFSKTRIFTGETFAKAIAEGKGDFIEKMTNKEVKIQGDMAIVFGRYTFHVGDKFSHCGTNSFHLVRTESGWKIANAASTLEFDCQKSAK